MSVSLKIPMQKNNEYPIFICHINSRIIRFKNGKTKATVTTIDSKPDKNVSTYKLGNVHNLSR